MFEQNPSILIFFFRVKVDAPLSSADVKFLLNQRREAKFVITSSKSKWVCKGDCQLEDWQKN